MTIEQFKQKYALIVKYDALCGVRKRYKETADRIEAAPDKFIIAQPFDISSGHGSERVEIFASHPLSAKYLLAGFAVAIQRLDLEIDKLKKEIEAD